MAALFALGALLGGTLSVRKVDVVGSNLPVADIIRTADVTGENIFAVRSDQIVERLASIPSINVDHVSTELPDKVVVYAQLRPAVAAWQTAGKLTLISADGTPLREVTTTGLPIIAGGTSPPNADMLVAVLYAQRTLHSIPDGSLSNFSLDAKGLAVVGQSGWRAELGKGSAQALALRVATLEALLREAAKRGRQIKYTDLRFKQPYTILKP